jgi:hypothetical protein
MTKNKKLLIITFLGIYLLGFAFGIIYAVNQSLTSQDAAPPIPLAPKRQIWVMVRLDQMTAVNPRLVSVWVLLASFIPAPQLNFKPIYSAEWKDAPNSALAKKFAVNSDRSLSEEFLKEIDQFDISRTGLVVMDNEGFSSFTGWFEALPVRQQTSAEHLLSWYFQPTHSEFQAYQHICKVLTADKPGSFTQPHWREQDPGHLILHPNPELFKTLWQQLFSSSALARCTVSPEP